LGDAADGQLGEAWQDRSEIVANRDFQPTTGFDYREDSCDARSGFLAAKVDPIFAIMQIFA
jgi:hypothetical protein